MKFHLIFGIHWLLLAILKIPQVESWNILPDGTPSSWFNLIGVRVGIAILLFRIAYLERKGAKS